MSKVFVYILVLVILFLLLFHWQVTSQIVSGASSAISGTISKLQKGV